MPFTRSADTDPELNSSTGTGIAALLKRLGSETGELVRAEVSLAKLEFRELARQTAREGLKVAAALALALVGVMALTSWGILALGEALGGRFGTAALVIGLMLVVAGTLLAWSGIRAMARSGGPGDTVASLREDRAWAAGELRDLQQELGEGAEEPKTRAALGHR